MKDFYVRSNYGVWEKVDDFVYSNHQFVVEDNGTRRYSDDRFRIVDNEVDLHVTGASEQDLSLIMRLCGIQPLDDSINCDFWPKPPQVLLKIVKGRSVVYYDSERRTTFKKVA